MSGGPPGLFDAALEVERLPDRFGLPAAFRHEQVRMPPREGVDALAPAVQMDGPDGPDAAVRIAAAVRTWCGEDAGQLPVRRVSAAGLRAQGEPVLTVADLGLVDDALLDDVRCPLRRIGDAESARWVRARRHRRGVAPTPGWIPYGQVPVRFLDRHPDEPVAHLPNHSGLGAAAGGPDALDAACAALVAEDAAMRWWLEDETGPAGDHPAAAAPAGPTPAPAGASPQARTDVVVEVRGLSSGVGVTVTLAAATSWPHGDDAPVTTLGAANDPGEAAARAAWQHTAARTLREGGRFAGGPPAGICPHRPDRRYLDDPAGLRRGSDPLAAVQVGLDPRVVARVRRRLDALPLHPAPAPARGAGTFAALVEAGHDVWTVDLTTPDVAPTGWRCVRVVVPGLLRFGVPAFHPARSAPPYPGW